MTAMDSDSHVRGTAGETDCTELQAGEAGAALVENEESAPNQVDAIESAVSPAKVTNVRDLDEVLAADLETVLEDEGDAFGAAEEIATTTQPVEASVPESAVAVGDAPVENAAEESARSPAASSASVPSPENEPTPDSVVDAAGVESRALAIARTLLSPLNWPLKLIPESKRIYVDWIALSLALWVPIIWLIAFLSRG